MREREDFGGIGKGDGAFAGGIGNVEEVDEECYHAYMCTGGGGNEVAQTGSEKRPEHLRECEEEKGAAAKCIDGPNGGPGKDKVD